jgi:hypothetical protein
MKGQYLTVEYVFFFAIGVAMIIGVYFLFFNMNDIIREDSARMQLTRTGELIRGSIIRVFESSNLTNSTVSYNLDIPPTLSNCIYRITADDNLHLNCTDNPQIGSVLSLYGINIASDEILYSTKGFIRIEGTGDGVVLG